MNLLSRIALVAGAVLAPAAAALAQTPAEIEPGQVVEFELAGRNVAFLVVDIPEGTGAMRVDLDAVDGVSDLDLLVRSGTPFQADGSIDPDALFDQSQYRSISATGDEFVVVSEASTFPMRAGPWYFAVFNFGSTATDARISTSTFDEAPVVPIEVVYNDSSDDCNTGPWSQSGRQAAMDFAAQKLTEELRPVAPIRVQGCWEESDEGTLAFAGPNFLFAHDLGFDTDRDTRFSGSVRFPSPMPWLPTRYNQYSAAAAAQNAGTSVCRLSGGSCTGVYDIRATFNTTADFYYGLDRETPASQSNFVSTAMHEITHGLGFYGAINVESGARSSQYEDPYTVNVRRNIVGVGLTPLLEMDDEQRLAALTSNNLRFYGDNAQAINGSSIKLYAPGEPNQGSTLSHLDTLTLGTELMAHRISRSAPHALGLAAPILFDVGWDPAPKAAPEPLLPPSGQYFDPQRDGHGIALYRIAGFEDFYFVVFYSYDEQGLPEYFVANGRVQDGVLVASRNEFGDSLTRSLYDESQSPPNAPDPATGFEGLIRIDFNEAARSPVCAGDSEPGESVTSAVVTFTLPGQDYEQWCLQGIAEGLEVDNDLTNIFFNAEDPGWGASVLSFPGADGDGLGMQVYYPDAEGNPRWAIMGTGSYEVGATYDLEQVVGYCRGCPKPATLERVKVGEVTIGLMPVDGGGTSTLSFDVSFDGGAGGSFTRNTTVIAGGAPSGD